MIGRYEAYYYFDDGSFYLLRISGHAVGHMCRLARVTAQPDESFIPMSRDACHHGGEMRPTEYLPLPSEISQWRRGRTPGI